MDYKIIEENIFLSEISAVNKHLIEIWDEIGLPSDQKREKLEEIRQELQETLSKIEATEVKHKEDIIKSIDELGLKLFQLTSEMKVPNVCEPAENLTLIELNKFLKDQLVNYEKEANDRIQKLKSLRDAEQELCSFLGEDIQVLPLNKIPSEETLQVMATIVNSLEKEKEIRIKDYHSLKISIKFYMEDLEISPSSIEELDLVFGNEDMVTLSMANIKKLKKLSSRLSQMVEEEKSQGLSMHDQIRLLWDRLEVDEETRSSAFLSMRESDSTAINNRKLREILGELEELKKQNLGRFVNQLRRELESWWEKCYVSEDEKENFAPYFADDYTDEILESHEVEVARLKIFYNENKELFLNIEKWQNLWKKVAELEKKAHDPARLFGNRGCSLLQEEKERKRVNLELPKVENLIQRKIDDWEREQGRPFLVCGKSLAVFIRSHWEQFNDNRNREKQNRHTQRNKQIQEEALLGATPAVTPKRKRPLNLPSSRNPKYIRNNNNERTPSSVSNCTLASTSTNSGSNRLRGQTRVTRINSFSKSRRAPTKTENHSNLTSYEQFTEEIQRRNEKETVNSSIFPQITVSMAKSPKKLGLSSNRFGASKGLGIDVPASCRSPLTPANNRFQSQRGSTPKAPATLPRRSSRLSGSQSSRLASSRLQRPSSRRSPYSNANKLSTPIRNKLSFLI